MKFVVGRYYEVKKGHFWLLMSNPPSSTTIQKVKLVGNFNMKVGFCFSSETIHTLDYSPVLKTWADYLGVESIKIVEPGYRFTVIGKLDSLVYVLGSGVGWLYGPSGRVARYFTEIKDVVD